MNDQRVEGTIEVDAAVRRQWDVVVVGAGVAGSVLAAGLAREGCEVLLLDKAAFPRAKTCGGMLNPRAVRALSQPGLSEVLHGLRPNPLAGVEWRHPAGSHAQLDFPAGAPFGALAVSRERLDAALLREAIRRGVAFLPRARCLGSNAGKDGRTLHLRMGDGRDISLRAGLVAACDGLGSVLASDAGLSVTRRPGPREYIGCSIIAPAEALGGVPTDRIVMALGKAGYTGVVRVEDSRWDVAAAVRVGALKGGRHPSGPALEALSSCGICTRGLRQTGPGHWAVTPPGLARKVRRRTAERLFLVGDAAGYAEPVTGEGMAWALEGVVRAIPLLAAGWAPERAATWERHRPARGLVRLAGMAAAHPLLGRTAIACLAAAPVIGRRLAMSLAEVAGPERA